MQTCEKTHLTIFVGGDPDGIRMDPDPKNVNIVLFNGFNDASATGTTELCALLAVFA